MKTRKRGKRRGTPARFLIRDERRPGHAWFYVDVHDKMARMVGQQAWSLYTTFCARAGNTGKGWLSVDYLARFWGCSRSTIKRGIRKLRNFGLIGLRYTGRVPEFWVLDPLKNLKARGVKNGPAEGPKLGLQRGQKWPTELDVIQLDVSELPRGHGSGTQRRENDGSPDGANGQRPQGLTPAERATWDYRRVSKELDSIRRASEGREVPFEQKLETALHRAGVTRARWREIEEQFK